MNAPERVKDFIILPNRILYGATGGDILRAFNGPFTVAVLLNKILRVSQSTFRMST